MSYDKLKVCCSLGKKANTIDIMVQGEGGKRGNVLSELVATTKEERIGRAVKGRQSE